VTVSAPVFDNVFAEVAALLLVAAVCGYIGRWLRQPLVVAFVAVGILVGPAGLHWVQSADQIDLLAKIGITLLLFVVGLRLDLHVIRSMGRVALAVGSGQVVFTSLAGYPIARALGLAPVPALYVAVALTFSSTVIIVKLLSDKREIDALHGRIALGILIVQDLVVVLTMIVLAGFGAAGRDDLLGPGMLGVVAGGVAFLGGVALVMRYVLPRLLDRLASSTELLMLFSVAWGVSLAALGESLGFGEEVGAFVAGVSLASTRYREAIGSRLVSLRDFLLLFFFVSLGAQQDISLLDTQVGPAVVLSLFVLIGNPLIVMIIMGAMGYRKRTGLLTGLTVAQISEFSFILASLGRDLGHIDSKVLGLITLVGLVTIALSTYMILYSHVLYEGFAPWLGLFERRMAHREEALDSPDAGPQADVIVFGLGRYGSRIVAGLRRRGAAVLGVDFDPEAVARCRSLGVPTHYGDAEDPEFPAHLPLARARWVVSTTPVREVNMALLHALRHHRFPGKVALTAHSAIDRDLLDQSGADLVLLPYADAADQAVDLLTEPGARPEHLATDRDDGPPAIDPDAEIGASRA
jgi:Kef-type K+ transport system membrane component KefB